MLKLWNNLYFRDHTIGVCVCVCVCMCVLSFFVFCCVCFVSTEIRHDIPFKSSQKRPFEMIIIHDYMWKIENIV